MPISYFPVVFLLYFFVFLIVSKISVQGSVEYVKIIADSKKVQNKELQGTEKGTQKDRNMSSIIDFNDFLIFIVPFSVRCALFHYFFVPFYCFL